MAQTGQARWVENTSSRPRPATSGRTAAAARAELVKAEKGGAAAVLADGLLRSLRAGGYAVDQVSTGNEADAAIARLSTETGPASPEKTQRLPVASRE